MHKLTIEDDEGKTVVVPLIRDEITVGRQEGNSIRLTERNISRRHARFFRQSGTLFVEDMGSFNGVKVNGGRVVAPTSLKDGDLVIIGDYKLTVRADRPVATRLYGAAAPFTAPPGTAAIPAPPLPATAAIPAGALGVQTRAAPVPSTAPPPEAALDAAPTIPVRTLAEQALAPGQAPGLAPARLVVITTNLAGTEFVLDRPSLVIGRTPENDIVLNHKSISRHHAKVIRDGDKYIVVDLESANGVRVNGSEFERVELKSGDTLELGHVRLRFTSGADYVDFDIGEAGRSRRRLVFAGAGGAVVVAGFALAFAMRGTDLGSTEPAKPPVASAPVAAGSPDPTPAPMPPVAALPSGPSGSPEGLIAQAKAAKAKENWDAALEAVKGALDLAPLSQEAVTLREAIESEQEASIRFAKIKEAARANNHQEVLSLFGGIAESSIYRPRALSLRRTAQGRVIALHLGEAQKAAGRGDCAQARTEADKVLAIEPEHDGARSAVEKCERAVAKATEKREREEREAAAREVAAKEAAEKAAAAKVAREARELAARQAKEARDQAAKEAREQAAREAAVREEAARVARIEREAREAAAKELAAKEKAARDAAAREQAAKDKVARDQAAKDKAIRDAAAREQAAKDKAIRDEAARVARAEKEAKDALAREAAAREAAVAKAAREEAAREKAIRDAAAREQAAKDKAIRDEAARVARAEKEAKDALAREAAAREAATREAATAKTAAAPPRPTVEGRTPPRPTEPRPAATSTSRPATPPPPRQVATASPTKPATPPEPPTPTGDPEAMLGDAQQAWLRGQYGLAIDSARRALKIRPSLTRAHQIIAACSCSLHDAPAATKAYERLVDDKQKSLVKTWCQKAGIELK
jgi:pSer/pThr/pTyr-binding forkhead associated (FHA) protein